MNYYILDNISDFNACQASCYAAFIAPIDPNSPYAIGTTKWADAAQRLTDDKYICPVCPEYDNAANYTIEQSQTNWFPGQGI